MAKSTGHGRRLRIRQIRSGIGFARPQRRVLAGLGLKHPHDEVVREDTPAVRGMVAKIRHLVRIVEEQP
jgi:large subunit ribosomal protein L30